MKTFKKQLKLKKTIKIYKKNNQKNLKKLMKTFKKQHEPLKKLYTTIQKPLKTNR